MAGGRCDRCGAAILWARFGYTDGPWRPLNAPEVDPREPGALVVTGRVLDGRTVRVAVPLAEVVAELQTRAGYTQARAEQFAVDGHIAHTLHQCAEPAARLDGAAA